MVSSPFYYKIRVFAKLTRLYQSFLSWIPFLLGYLLVINFKPSSQDLILLIFADIVFFLLIYGAIYIFNDLIDLKSDVKHPFKSRGRAIASGEISPKIATTIALILLTAGLIFSYLIGIKVFILSLIFISINLTYTLILKKIPYLDILGNCLTHPLRTISGIILAGGTVLIYKDLLLTHLLGEISVTTARRYREFQNGYSDARPILKKTNKSLLFLIQYTFLSFQWLHLFFTLSSPGTFFRLMYALGCTIVIIMYKRNSTVTYVVDAVSYGEHNPVNAPKRHLQKALK